MSPHLEIISNYIFFCVDVECKTWDCEFDLFPLPKETTISVRIERKVTPKSQNATYRAPFRTTQDETKCFMVYALFSNILKQDETQRILASTFKTFLPCPRFQCLKLDGQKHLQCT